MGMKIEMTWPPMSEGCQQHESRLIQANFSLTFKEIARTYPHFPGSIFKARLLDVFADVADVMRERKLAFTDIDEITIKPGKVTVDIIPDMPSFMFHIEIKLRSK